VCCWCPYAALGRDNDDVPRRDRIRVRRQSRLTNLPVTYLGGLAIGWLRPCCRNTSSNSTGLTGGLSASLPFLVLFVLLLAAPRLRRPSTRVSAADRRQQLATAYGATGLRDPRPTGGTGSRASVGELHIADWTRFLAYTVLFSRSVCWCECPARSRWPTSASWRSARLAFSHLAVDHHCPWFAAVIVAGGLIAAPIVRSWRFPHPFPRSVSGARDLRLRDPAPADVLCASYCSARSARDLDSEATPELVNLASDNGYTTWYSQSHRSHGSVVMINRSSWAGAASHG